MDLYLLGKFPVTFPGATMLLPKTVERGLSLLEGLLIPVGPFPEGLLFLVVFLRILDLEDEILSSSASLDGFLEVVGVGSPFGSNLASNRAEIPVSTRCGIFQGSPEAAASGEEETCRSYHDRACGDGRHRQDREGIRILSVNFSGFSLLAARGLIGAVGAATAALRCGFSGYLFLTEADVPHHGHDGTGFPG